MTMTTVTRLDTDDEPYVDVIAVERVLAGDRDVPLTRLEREHATVLILRREPDASIERVRYVLGCGYGTATGLLARARQVM